MKTLLSLFIGLLLPILAHATDAIAISKVHDQPSDDTRTMVLEYGDSTESLHVDRSPVIRDNDIAEASLSKGDPSIIQIILTEEGKKNFSEVTREWIGKRLAILLNGKLVMAPVIRAEITDGRLAISGNMPEGSSEKIIQEINRSKGDR